MSAPAKITIECESALQAIGTFGKIITLEISDWQAQERIEAAIDAAIKAFKASLTNALSNDEQSK